MGTRYRCRLPAPPRPHKNQKARIPLVWIDGSNLWLNIYYFYKKVATTSSFMKLQTADLFGSSQLCHIHIWLQFSLVAVRAAKETV